MNTKMMDHFSFELLADYVEGFVDHDTKEAIERRIQEDEVTRNIVQGIQFWFEKNGEDRKGLERYLNDFSGRLNDRIVNAEPEKPITKKEKGSFGWLRIAAAVVLAAGALAIAGVFSNGPSSDKLITAALAEEYRAPSTVRGTVEDDQAWLAFKTAWAEDDFATAADLAGNISNPTEEQIFYLGMAELYHDEFGKAATVLQQVAGLNNAYSEQARWFAALAMFQKGDTAFATGIIRKIAEDQGHFKQAEAAAILESL